MQYDRTKLRAAILYAAKSCPPEQMGATKLHKVLYFADMMSYATSGAAMTGATYRKRPFGPTCDELLPTLRDLAIEGDLEVREVDYFGYLKKEYIAKTDASNVLSEGERELLDEVVDFVCHANTAKTISEFSHTRAWEMAEGGEILPYSTALYIIPEQAPPEALEWAAEEMARIDATESSGNPVGSSDLRDFRSRILARH